MINFRTKDITMNNKIGHRGMIRQQVTQLPDWCHICGARSFDNLEIFYPRNAEHKDGHERYIRICGGCVKRLQDTMALAL